LNILDGFLLHANNQATAPAMCAPGWNYNLVSYGRLRVFANNVAAHALRAGLQPGDVVAIVVRDPIFHMALVGSDPHRRCFAVHS
jgi:acyl-CoA synthetase (AMP-forming)/AMP-acid ligase II